MIVLAAFGCWVLAAFGGGELLAIAIPTLRPLVFLLSPETSIKVSTVEADCPQPPSLSTPSLHHYLLHYSIMSDENHVFCAFMDVVTNSSTLRACSFRYKVHSRIIHNLLDEYYSHQLSRTRQEKKHMVETNNHNQITRWSQERLGLNHGNHTYTDWELLNACKIRVLLNTSYAQLKYEYSILNSTMKH